MRSVLTLALLTAMSGCIVAVANLYTSEPIERNNKLNELNRLEGLVDTTDLEDLCERGIYLVEIQTRGYGGPMQIVVAMHREELLGARVVRHSETPGFSDVLEPEDWMGSFGKVPLSEIDTVTRATVTTNAVLRAIQDHLLVNELELGEC